MFKNKLKRLCAVTLAGMMVVSVSACSTSKSAEKNSVSKTEQAPEATTEAAKDDTTADYVASGVELPDNFENMIYPIEALMLQNYSKGYPYYANGASEEKSDSFWFSMAALTSLMENESAYGDGIEMDSYYYLKENTSNMYASALYNAYGMGNMEFPEIPDGDKYATYDDGKQMYGFLKGEVSSLVPYITNCVKDGSDYTHSSDGASMYTNRDPRLAAIIGYDGSVYGKNTIYTRISDNTTIDGLNQVKNRSTNTGYYLAKFLDKTLNFGQANVGTVFHLFPMIRLSDILLSYAEAMHHAYGMSADPEGYGLTAIEAIQKIRTRAGFGTNDKFLNGVTDNNFMEKVKQERRIELCFEEHRYFDLRRWMDGNQLREPIIGMKVEENASGLHYTRITVDEARNFKDYMYYHPIPLKVIKESPSIQQNPGW